MTHATHPQQFHPDHVNQVKTASGLNFLAGIYLLISALVNAASGGAKANGVIFGIIVAILAATRFSGASGSWASWIDALIGVWVILSPWIYHFAGQAWMWSPIVVGIVMVVLGVWSALAGSARRATPNMPAAPSA